MFEAQLRHPQYVVVIVDTGDAMQFLAHLFIPQLAMKEE